MNNKVSIYGIFGIISLSIGLNNHVLLIPMILQSGHRDAWFGVIIGTILACLWTFALYIVLRNIRQQSLRAWLEDRCGLLVTKVIIISISFVIFCLNIITLARCISFIKLVYLPRTPTMIILLLVISLCAYLATKRIHGIAVTAGILIPFVILLGIFISLVNMKIKNYSYLTPLFEQGLTPTWNSSLITLGGLLQLSIVLFLSHHVKVKMSWMFLVIMVLFLGELVLGPLMGAISIYGPENAVKMRLPAFEQWRMLTLTRYLMHVDFLAFFQWMSGVIIQISLFFFIISENLESRKVKQPIIIIIIGIVSFCILTIPISLKFIEWITLHYYAKASLWAFSSFTIVLLLLVLVRPKAKGSGTL